MSNWANEGGKPIPDWLKIVLVAALVVLMAAAIKSGGFKRDGDTEPSPSKSAHSLGRMYSEEGSRSIGSGHLVGIHQ